MYFPQNSFSVGSWQGINIAAGANDVAAQFSSLFTTSRYMVPFNCLVSHLSIAWNALVTAGTYDILVFKNGVQVANTGNQTAQFLNHVLSTPPGFAAGDGLSIFIDTSAGFLPAGTNDVAVFAHLVGVA